MVTLCCLHVSISPLQFTGLMRKRRQHITNRTQESKDILKIKQIITQQYVTLLSNLVWLNLVLNLCGSYSLSFVMKRPGSRLVLGELGGSIHTFQTDNLFKQQTDDVRHNLKAYMYVQKALLQSCGVTPHRGSGGEGVHRKRESRKPAAWYKGEADSNTDCTVCGQPWG